MPEALWHVLATVAWQWVGLVGNVALVWVIARVAPSLVAGVAVQKVALPLLARASSCSQCRAHCYAPAQRQAIKDVMRYAGPRMLLSHPVMTVCHGIDTLRARQSHQ